MLDESSVEGQQVAKGSTEHAGRSTVVKDPVSLVAATNEGFPQRCWLPFVDHNQVKRASGSRIVGCTYIPPLEASSESGSVRVASAVFALVWRLKGGC